jgi:lysozyme
LKTSIYGTSLIKKYEGLRLKQYFCPANVSTIGYGTTLINGKPVPVGLVITLEQANEYLQHDLIKFESGVDVLVTSTINQYQFDALVSFAYNLGLGNLKSSTLLKKVNLNPNDKTIYNEFIKWNKAGGIILQGLANRRKEEAELYFKP